jgi:elongation factor Ts
MSISAKDVKVLREKTGLGMMDCKKALTECDGDMDKAMDWLRKKGMAKSSKLAGRIAAEGVVAGYMHHNGKLGVMVELNCETDFTAKNADFVKLAEDITTHIAVAAPTYLSREDVPAELIAKEEEIARDQMADSGKPAQVIEGIIKGKVEKFFKENCLLEQESAVSDEKKSVQQMIDEKVAKIGEKITLRRFVRFELGQGLEKRSDNFAEEVAKQVGQ